MQYQADKYLHYRWINRVFQGAFFYPLLFANYTRELCVGFPRQIIQMRWWYSTLLVCMLNRGLHRFFRRRMSHSHIFCSSLHANLLKCAKYLFALYWSANLSGSFLINTEPLTRVCVNEHRKLSFHIFKLNEPLYLFCLPVSFPFSSFVRLSLLLIYWGMISKSFAEVSQLSVMHLAHHWKNHSPNCMISIFVWKIFPETFFWSVPSFIPWSF